MEAMKSAAVDALLGHQAKLDAILAADLAVDCLNGSKLDLLKLKVFCHPHALSGMH